MTGQLEPARDEGAQLIVVVDQKNGGHRRMVMRVERLAYLIIR